jgi:hypothetical protein
MRKTFSDFVNIIMDKVDVPNLIRNNNYTSVSFIKNYEDTLQKLFKSHGNSSLTNEQKIFLWPISQEDNNDLFENLITFSPEEYNVQGNLKNVAITGPYIRSCLISDKSTIKNTNIRKEIYLYRFGTLSWSDLIDNIDEYTEKDNEYTLDLEDNKKVTLIKKKFKSLSHVILQHDYLKRVGWHDNKFYVSSMFLIEFQKHKEQIMNKFKDPILNMPYDPLGIYLFNDKNQVNYPVKVIESVDLDELVELSEKDIIRSYNSKTLIEICIDRYVNEDHPFILENLEKMIIYLSKYTYKRPPFYYAIVSKLKNKNENIYNLLSSLNRQYSIDQSNLNSIEDINNAIIESIIKKDDADDLLDFILFISNSSKKNAIDKTLIEKVIRYNSKDIMRELISNQILDEYLMYYLILMSESIDLMQNSIGFDIEIATNFLKEIVTHGAYESFNYLIDNDESTITRLFEGNRNLLHIIKPNGKFDKIIDKIIQLKPELVEMCDNFGDNPIIYHAKNTPMLLEYFMKYDVIDMTISDSNGNSCLHHLCKQNEINVLKKFLKTYPELINMPNLNAEYPIIIACKSKQEDMFYVLKNNGADLTARDCFGNTVYHYICANSICLGITVYNIQNSFGLTPKDYCKLSPKYYNFQ